MGFIKISFLLLSVFCFFTLKASGIDEESWKLAGTFFLKKRCYISLQDTSKTNEGGSIQNSLMMGLDCEAFIPPPQEVPCWKAPLKKRDIFRRCAIYNSFFFHQKAISNLFRDEMFEVDLLENAFLRSIVISTLRGGLKQGDSLIAVLVAGKILNLLGDRSS